MNVNDNVNLLYGKDLRFEILRLPNVTYFIKDVEIPSISSGAAEMPTPFTTLPFHPDHLTFDPLTITFRVDEDLRNYEELFSWMVSFGTPSTFTGYLDSSNNPLATKGKNPHKSHYSQGTIFTSTNKDNPNVQFIFEDLFPIMLGSLQLDVTAENPQPLVCTSTFRYTKFSISR